jgi:putative acetyltransferase
MSKLTFRPIRPEDDPAVADIIRRVMTEFGASGKGFAIHDPEVNAMSAAYDQPRAAYFVVEDDRRVVGGAGVAHLEGAEEHLCELRKMYFLPEARGRGMGRTLLLHCLAVATDFGYSTCYLETLTGMDAAQHLYEQLGFRKICQPLGATGHHGCDRWYTLDLKK